jgi:hypothetical protein
MICYKFLDFGFERRFIAMFGVAGNLEVMCNPTYKKWNNCDGIFYFMNDDYCSRDILLY